MKNNENLELLLTPLTEKESNEINAGDGLTEAFFSAIGFCVTKITICRSKMSYKNTSTLYPAGICF